MANLNLNLIEVYERELLETQPWTKQGMSNKGHGELSAVMGIGTNANK